MSAQQTSKVRFLVQYDGRTVAEGTCDLVYPASMVRPTTVGDYDLIEQLIREDYDREGWSLGARIVVVGVSAGQEA